MGVPVQIFPSSNSANSVTGGIIIQFVGLKWWSPVVLHWTQVRHFWDYFLYEAYNFGFWVLNLDPWIAQNACSSG